MIFAYIAPEVVLPLTSAITAVVGFVMLVGRSPIRYARKGLHSGPGAAAGRQGCTAPFRLVGRGVRNVGKGVASPRSSDLRGAGTKSSDSPMAGMKTGRLDFSRA